MKFLRARTKEELEVVLQEFVEKAKCIIGINLDKIILFGSYANGSYDAESDIDIMILVKENDEEIRKMERMLINATTDIDLAHNVLLSPMIANSDRFYKYVNDLPFYKTVQSGGIVFYEQ